MGNDEESPVSEQEKAKIRRAQVRKAQTEHRKRKANYVKQLELDVSRLREQIAVTDKERKAIRFENETIRLQLNASLLPVGLPPLPLPAAESQFADISLDDVTMTFVMDEAMGTPAFQVSSSSSSSSSPGYKASPRSQAVATGAALPEMTPEQTQQAVNFVLA